MGDELKTFAIASLAVVMGAVPLFLQIKGGGRKPLWKRLKLGGWIIVVAFLGQIILLIFKSIDDNKASKEKEKQILILHKRLNLANHKLDSANSKLDRIIVLAYEAFPESPNKNVAVEKYLAKLEANEKAIIDVTATQRKLATELEDEKNTIKRFTAIMEVEFSGKWQQQPYSQATTYRIPVIFLQFQDTQGNLPNVKFTSLTSTGREVDKQRGIFYCEMEFYPGEAPLGKRIKDLEGYDRMTFLLPFGFAQNLEDYNISIDRVGMVFSINGIKKGMFNHEIPSTINIESLLKVGGGDASADVNIVFDAPDGNLLRSLKILP